MSIEYVLNLKSHAVPVLHLRIDGRSREQCNLDQLKRTATYADLPEGHWSWCARCRKDHPA